jgi:hypothetical protein
MAASMRNSATILRDSPVQTTRLLAYEARRLQPLPGSHRCKAAEKPLHSPQLMAGKWPGCFDISLSWLARVIGPQVRDSLESLWQ